MLSEDDLVYESDRDVLLEDPPRFFNGDKDFPIVDIDTLEVEDVMSLLFNPPASHACQRQPRKYQINALFIIDTRELAGSSDWKADNLGVFDNVGRVYMGYFLIGNDGTATFLSKKKTEILLPVPGQTIKATKTYCVHQKHKDFKSRAIELESEKNRHLPFVFVKLKSEVKSKKSVAGIYNKAFEDAGGVLTFQARGDLPRNIKQVPNLKYETSGSKKEKDDLYAVLEKSQTEPVKFVKKVQ